MAARFGRGLAVAPQDILHIALISVLSESRQCPRDIDFKNFLIGAIRSTAFNQRELKDNQCYSIDEGTDQSDNSPHEIVCQAPTPEEKLIDKDRIEKQRNLLRQLMRDDREAILYLHALARDWSVSEIKTNLGFDAKKLEAVQTRIRRRANEIKREQS
jgi:DNA-directed RNA polymerase specialized sigma24 family protein